MGNYIYYSLIFSGIAIFSYLSYRSEKKQKNYYQKITSAYTMDWGATPSSHRVPTFGKAGEDSSAEGSAVHKNERSDTLGETPESVPARDVEEFVESFTNIVQRRPLLFPIAGWAMMITIIFFVGYIALAFIARRPSEEYVPFIFVVCVTFPVAVFCIRFEEPFCATVFPSCNGAYCFWHDKRERSGASNLLYGAKKSFTIILLLAG